MADEQTDVRIPIVEERLVTEKQRVETGKVRVRTLVEEEQQTVRERLARTHVEVERVPIEREVAEVPPVREEDGITIVPVVREMLVVTKKLILVEEVRLKSVTSFEDHAEPVTLRVQRAVVERDELSGEQQTQPEENI